MRMTKQHVDSLRSWLDRLRGVDWAAYRSVALGLIEQAEESLDALLRSVEGLRTLLKADVAQSQAHAVALEFELARLKTERRQLELIIKSAGQKVARKARKGGSLARILSSNKPDGKISECLGALASGKGVRATAKECQLAKQTVENWLCRAIAARSRLEGQLDPEVLRFIDGLRRGEGNRIEKRLSCRCGREEWVRIDRIHCDRCSAKAGNPRLRAGASMAKESQELVN